MSFYLFISILCSKILCVNWASEGEGKREVERGIERGAKDCKEVETRRETGNIYTK
jgi:hypothetical protein